MMIPIKSLFRSCGLLSVLLFSHCQQGAENENQAPPSAVYYLNAAGNDANDGSKAHPWKSIAAVNNKLLRPGDTVYFESGQSFAGSILLDSGDKGTKEQPIVLSSTANTKATINGGDITALTLSQTAHIRVVNLAFTGTGRKTGNSKNGVIVNTCTDIFIDSLRISGFQKSGLMVYNSARVEVHRVHALENGFAGILITGQQAKTDCHDILVRNCLAENNPGDPTNFTNHSGNGILAGLCRKVTIEYCTATNNGWDMPRTGNGPVGIWTYESDSVLIQHCLAYRNKTSPGANDGGGFDLDGGVTNATIQYCLSYENQGSGYGIFQYAGASNWHTNILRYNISENDGAVTGHCAGILIWNSSGDGNQFKDCLVYNNTIYNSKAPALAYSTESVNSGFKFYNNIFVGKKEIVTGQEATVVYLGNNWHSIADGFHVDGMTDFQAWVDAHNKEKYNNQVVGHHIDPLFTNPGTATISSAAQLSAFPSYQLPAGSALRTGGLNLQQLFGIDNGGKTFNQTPAPVNGIGAVF